MKPTLLTQPAQPHQTGKMILRLAILGIVLLSLGYAALQCCAGCINLLR
jgi:hypothetical protein